MTGVRPYILLGLLCLVFYLPGQGTLPPVDRDEARFAQATRQMAQTGDYINIRFQDTPRHKKPGGIYWLQAASLKAFGEVDASRIWPYRLPSVLGAILSVWLCFAIGCVLFERRIAFLGAALLASSVLLVVEAHLAKTDAMLLATVLMAQYALARTYMAGKGGRETGWGVALLFWGALGASGLIKGPVGPMVVLLTLGALYLTARPRGLLRRLKPLAGIPLTLAIVAPWLIAIMAATGGSFVGDAVRSDLLPKLISGQESHGFPPGFFLLLMTATLWPASFFVWHGLVWAWRNRREAPVTFCIAWVVPSWIVFELVPTKLPHYVLPLYPALALIAARAAFALSEGGIIRYRSWDSRIALFAFAGIALAIGGGLVVLPILLDGRFDPLSLLPLAAAIGVAIYAMKRAFEARMVAALSAAILGAAVILGSSNQWNLPRIEALWLSRSVSALVEKSRAGGAARPLVAASGYHEPSLVFMLGRATKLTMAADVALQMRKDPSILGLIAASDEAPFRRALAGLAVRAIGTARGFNYSKGHWAALTLYRVAGAP
ncbi:MAG: ArnT family glycosyltransferase [Alphaproteobacteria bacterium]